MKKVLLTLLSLILCTSAFAQGNDIPRKRQGAAAGYATRDATVLSMMGWGISIAVGIAAISALVSENITTGSSSTAH